MKTKDAIQRIRKINIQLYALEIKAVRLNVRKRKLEAEKRKLVKGIPAVDKLLYETSLRRAKAL